MEQKFVCYVDYTQKKVYSLMNMSKHNSREDGQFYSGIFSDGIHGTSFAYYKDIFDNEEDAKNHCEKANRE